VLASPRIHDDLVDALAEQARGTRTGPAVRQDAAYGPLNNAAQLERVGGFVERLPDHARLVSAGPGSASAGSSTSRPWWPAWRATTR
jgi:betaine-aldehyde dehydrogenase